MSGRKSMSQLKAIINNQLSNYKPINQFGNSVKNEIHKLVQNEIVVNFESVFIH